MNVETALTAFGFAVLIDGEPWVTVPERYRANEIAAQVRSGALVCAVCRKLVEPEPRYFCRDGRPRHMLCQPLDEADDEGPTWHRRPLLSEVPMRGYRPLNDPVGSWWAAFDNGEVWPVKVLSTNVFGTRVVATHDAAPQGEITLHPQRVYDSDFNRPKPLYLGTPTERKRLTCRKPDCHRTPAMCGHGYCADHNPM